MSTSRSRLRQPQVEHRPERLAAGHDLGGRRRPRPAAASAACEIARTRIVERRRLHARRPFVRRARPAIASRTRRGVIGDCSNLDAERPQRVVDRIGDRGRRRDRAAFADALLAELGVGRRRLHVIETRLPAPRSGPAADSRQASRRAAGRPRRTASPRRARCRCPARGRHRSGRRRPSD